MEPFDIPTLETERLRLRPFRPEDIDDYAALFADPEVLRYLGGGTEPWDRGRSWRHMAFLVGHWRLKGAGMWAVEQRETGAFVGAAGCLAGFLRGCLRSPGPRAPHPLTPSPTPSLPTGRGGTRGGGRGRPSPGRREGVGEGTGVRGLWLAQGLSKHPLRENSPPTCDVLRGGLVFPRKVA